MIAAIHALSIQTQVELIEPESGLLDFFFDLLPSFAVMLMFATAIIHICFATWVYADAQALVQERRDRQAVVFSPLLWLLAVLVTGIAGLAVYWAIHRSTLSPANLVETE